MLVKKMKRNSIFDALKRDWGFGVRHGGDGCFMGFRKDCAAAESWHGKCKVRSEQLCLTTKGGKS